MRKAWTGGASQTPSRPFKFTSLGAEARAYGSSANGSPPTPPVHRNSSIGLAFWSWLEGELCVLVRICQGSLEIQGSSRGPCDDPSSRSRNTLLVLIAACPSGDTHQRLATKRACSRLNPSNSTTHRKHVQSVRHREKQLLCGVSRRQWSRPTRAIGTQTMMMLTLRATPTPLCERLFAVILLQRRRISGLRPAIVIHPACACS